MSLEAAITKLNTNIEVLISVMGGKAPFDVEAATAAAKEKVDAAFKARTAKKPEAPAKPAEQSTAEATPAESTAETPAETSAPTDYEKDVKPVALAVAKKHKREGLRAILDKFVSPAETAANLKPEQYAAFLKACNEALA